MYLLLTGRIVSRGDGMEFRGVDETTIENGRALNAAFLALATGPAAPAGLETDFKRRLRQLDARHLERLSRTPFLLFAVAVVETKPGPGTPLRDSMNLFDDPMSKAETRLVIATLSLLWSLARADRHAARFLAGTPRGWCEEIAAASLVDVLDTTRQYDTMVVPRSATQRAFWDKLFVSACDRRPSVRRAARQSALQCVLTELRDDSFGPVAVAACRTRAPARRAAK